MLVNKIFAILKEYIPKNQTSYIFDHFLLVFPIYIQ